MRLLTLILLFPVLPAVSQLNPPCGDTYGSTSDENNIIFEMRYGSIIDAVSAIDQAKNTRGLALGCPEVALSYASPNTTEPLLNDIVAIWNSTHAPSISSFISNCPRIGRYDNNAALGAYYAMQAGYYTDTAVLADIANMMYDQQYASWNTSSPDTRNEGVFGYLNVPGTDPCYPGGVVGSSVTALCSTLPNYCVGYTSGQFIGENFAISGQDDLNNWFDGGLAYDHGWVGVQMIESGIMQSNPTLKQKYRNSAALAAQYALAEYPVKNHNYTAKLIWFLAQMYAWTDDLNYKTELNYKLDKNLIPGVLWDANTDGFVDGTSPQIAFNTLTPIAQMPGRMWDGHNATAWYHAMNTWAMTEAYVAFRDRGDLARANELKPYMIAMLDNLTNEILTEGVVSPDALGVRDITYALLTAIWKVSAYENDSHLNWENAAWAMWNSGYFNTYSTHSVCVGLYLLVQSNTPYTPLAVRENYMLGSDNLVLTHAKLYPNPASDFVHIDIPQHHGLTYKITAITGQCVQQADLHVGGDISISRLIDGLYQLTLYDEGKLVSRTKLIKSSY